jgi:hypothetical protein
MGSWSQQTRFPSRFPGVLGDYRENENALITRNTGFSHRSFPEIPIIPIRGDVRLCSAHGHENARSDHFRRADQQNERNSVRRRP